MMLSNVLNNSRLILLPLNEFLQELLVVSGPFLNGQFCDMQDSFFVNLIFSFDQVPFVISLEYDFTFITLIKGVEIAEICVFESLESL